MKKRIPKSECTRKIEWDRSILKILTFCWRAKVHLVKTFSPFFFFFFISCGSDRIRFPGQTGSAGQTGQTGIVEDDVIHDVIALEARVARVRGLSVSARVSAWTDPSEYRTLWWRVEARGSSFGPEIFMFCRSEAVEDFYGVSFLKLWTYLHSFEGLGRGSSRVCGGAWRRVQPFLGLKF